MTNGEKLREVFPNMRIDVFVSYVQVVGGNYEFNNLYPLKWWNAEYKESTTKNETLVSLGAYKQVAFERDIAVEQLKELGYQLGEKVRKADDCISRKAVITIIQNHWWNCRDIDKLVNELPPVKSIRPEGHWIDVMEGNTLKVECSECKKRQFSKTNFCSSCGSYNREVVEE